MCKRTFKQKQKKMLELEIGDVFIVISGHLLNTLIPATLPEAIAPLSGTNIDRHGKIETQLSYFS